MGRINAAMRHDETGLDWKERLAITSELAKELGIVRIDRKAPVGERGHYSISVSADEVRPLELFVTSLFRLIGDPDSPIFYISTKNRRDLPAFSKRLVQAPLEPGAGAVC